MRHGYTFYWHQQERWESAINVGCFCINFVGVLLGRPHVIIVVTVFHKRGALDPPGPHNGTQAHNEQGSLFQNFFITSDLGHDPLDQLIILVFHEAES